MKFMTILPHILLASGVQSIPTEPSKRQENPCSVVRRQFGEAGPPKDPAARRLKPSRGVFRRQLPSDSLPRIPGQAAQDCLETIPYDAPRSQAFITELKKYLEFQSTLEILKAPPKSYLSEPVDIMQGLDAIGGKNYTSLYAFDRDVKALITSAHDSHFDIRPYITEINGKPVAEYLEGIARTSKSQDPDARWNELFFSPTWFASKTLPPSGTFVNNEGSWPGDAKTTLKFRNGTTVDLETKAAPRGEKPIDSGEQAIEAYCKPEPPPKPEPAPPENGPIRGYPEPVVRDPNNQVTGYFLDNETAVLAVSTFGGPGEAEDYSVTYAKTVIDFMNKAKESGREKMIVDMSGNGGGSPIRLLNLFQLFFPEKFPFDALRFRRHATADTMTKIFAQADVPLSNEVGVGLAFKAMSFPNQKDGFSTPEQMLGDAQEFGAAVSSIYTLNFTLAASDKDPIEGFQPKQQTFKQQPFKTENLLVMGNGWCHSSCAGFINLMANVGGVKTLAFGGRPAVGPMQIMGGVRGGSVKQMGELSEVIQLANEVANNASKSAPDGLSKELAEGAGPSLPVPIQDMPYKLDGQVNFENTYLEGKEDRPLQFEFQAADCRLFYTADNIVDLKTSWADAKKATWGGGKCVEGSSGQSAQDKNPAAKEKIASQGAIPPGVSRCGGPRYNNTRTFSSAIKVVHKVGVEVRAGGK